MNEDIYMGFVTEGHCTECGKPTFAADEVCFDCKIEMSKEEQDYFYGLSGLDCE